MGRPFDALHLPGIVSKYRLSGACDLQSQVQVAVALQAVSTLAGIARHAGISAVKSKDVHQIPVPQLSLHELNCMRRQDVGDAAVQEATISALSEVYGKVLPCIFCDASSLSHGQHECLSIWFCMSSRTQHKSGSTQKAAYIWAC